MSELNQENLRTNISLNSHLYSVWSDEHSGIDRFGVGELVTFLTSVTLALTQINGSLKTAQEAVERLEKLYRWATGQKNDVSNNNDGDLSLGEHLLALLADASATSDGEVSLEQLAEICKSSKEECIKELERLKRNGFAFSSGNTWSFKTLPTF